MFPAVLMSAFLRRRRTEALVAPPTASFVLVLTLLVLQMAMFGIATDSEFDIDGTFSEELSPDPLCSRVLPLRLRQFPSWEEYLRWRETITPPCAASQPVHPCVRGDGHWACLPKLVVIGAMKAGTTGLRNLLTASGLFSTKSRHVAEDNSTVFLETHYWDNQGPGRFTGGADMSDIAVLQEWVNITGRFASDVEWSDLVDDNGFARRLTLDVTPSYSRYLEQRDVLRILRINPDVHFLLLARDPADAMISAADMAICSGKGSSQECGAVGCEQSPTELFPSLKVTNQEGKSCTPETIPCSLFHSKMKNVTAENQLRETEYMLGSRLDNSMQHGYKVFGRWRYPWLLHQQWLPLVPKSQMHVFRSDYLWHEPQHALDTLGSLLKLPFQIPADTDVNTKPKRQTECHCSDAQANLEAFHAIIDRCQLRHAISCAHFHSNELMQEVMASVFPYGSPPSRPFLDWDRGLTPTECERLGFGVDVNYMSSVL